MHPHELEEIEYRSGPVLWDATPGVCCAAYHLGACDHTEAWDSDFYAEEEARWRAEKPRRGRRPGCRPRRMAGGGGGPPGRDCRGPLLMGATT